MEYAIQMASVRIFYASGGETSIDISTGFVWGEPFQFRVRACRIAGCGAWSGWSNAVVPSQLPSNPGTPATSIDDREITVTFGRPSLDGGAPITRYELAAEHTFGSQTFADPESHTWTGNYGQSNRFRVRACNINGCSSWSTWSQPATPTTVPGPPGAPSVSTWAGGVSMTFAEPASDGGSYIQWYDVIDERASVSGTAYTLSFSYFWGQLDGGPGHRFRVRACNTNGCGSWGGWSNTVTRPDP